MKHSTLIVGLTGGIGSGKSEASKSFAARHIAVVDADQIARDVVMPGSAALEKISAHFGADIIHQGGVLKGELNRAKLRDIIFSIPEEKIWLEQLLHPLINHQIRVQLLRAESQYVVLSSPLLLETEQHQLVNRILVIDTSEQMQIDRAGERDSKNEAQIKAIMQTQLSRQDRCARATDIIRNHGNLEDLDNQVEKLHQLYLELANTKPSF